MRLYKDKILHDSRNKVSMASQTPTTSSSSERSSEFLDKQGCVLQKVTELKDYARKFHESAPTFNNDCYSRRASVFLEEIDQLSRRMNDFFSIDHTSIRIASWNIQAQNKEYDEPIDRICSTIKHYDFDVIGIQEIGAQGKNLTSILKILNEDGVYESNLPEHGEVHIGGTFLWKKYSVSLEEEDSVNKKIQDKYVFQNNINCTQFKIKGTGKFFAIWNFHFTRRDYLVKKFCGLNGIRCNDKEQKYLYKILDQKEYDLRKTILLGDFKAIPRPCRLDGKKFNPMFDESTPTNTSRTATYDNIILPEIMGRCHREVGNIYSEKDKSLTMEDAQAVSDHLPIFVDIPFNKFVSH